MKNDTSDYWTENKAIKTNTLLHSRREQTVVSNRMKRNMTHWHSSVYHHIYELHFVVFLLCYLFLVNSKLSFHF